LAPLALAALLALRRRTVSAAAAAALGGAALVLASEPNARYLYPALPLLFLPCAALLGWARERYAWLAWALSGFLALCAALNLWFLPASGWYQKNFYSHAVFTRGGRARFLRDSAPLRDVAAHYRALPAHPPVLLTDDYDLADVASADAYSNNWHQYGVWKSLEDARGVSGIARLIGAWKIEYFLWRRPERGAAIVPAALGEFIESCTDVVYANHEYILSRLRKGCPAAAGAAGLAE